LLNDKYKLNHCKEMGAEPGRRFLIQLAAKLEPESLYFCSVNSLVFAIRSVTAVQFPQQTMI